MGAFGAHYPSLSLAVSVDAGQHMSALVSPGLDWSAQYSPGQSGPAPVSRPAPVGLRRHQLAQSAPARWVGFMPVRRAGIMGAFGAHYPSLRLPVSVGPCQPRVVLVGAGRPWSAPVAPA